MKARQRDFFEKAREHAPRRISHGGSSAHGLRKIARPLDRKKPVHLVLKSSHAKGAMNLLGAKNKLQTEKIVRTRAKQFGVTIHEYENVGNHLHIIASFAKRELFQNFLRTVTALIARHVTGARKGKPFGKRFWDHLAFTRVITGRRDRLVVAEYVDRNRIEAEFGSKGRELFERFEARSREEIRKWVSLGRDHITASEKGA